MAIGTPVITVNSRLVGGPNKICFTVTAESGDTSATVDLTNYVASKIKHVDNITGYKAAAKQEILTKDITTDPKKVTFTFADPTENITWEGSVIVE